MASNGTNGNQKKDPVLVVVQQSGGNDFLNTVIPFENGHYWDSRPIIRIERDNMVPFTDDLAFHGAAAPFKDLFDAGDMAIIQGIGYENSSRSHFRGMDIWHTAEPNSLATEGWLGQTIRELDPGQKNVLTGVSFGRGLPRAMAAPGVPVASIGDLDNYGLMTPVEIEEERNKDLDIFKRMYTPAFGSGVVMDYLGQTGRDSLVGADILKKAPAMYESTVEYADNSIAKALRDVARIHLAGLGTRIFYTQHGGYDHHAQELPAHEKLLAELTGAIRDFLDDLRQHDASDNVLILVFTEFGRRMKDNGSGTDHGSGGGAFLIGDRVTGGLYSEYPSIDPADWLNDEDMKHTIDFRSIYATILEQWIGIESTDIVRGKYEQISPFTAA
ncbi:MAG: DUF1501 domain-containing protein [Chloroflexi bacterium]|nr:DUF1501 domain-containing protein [Chloroflexota bacterium]